MLYIFKIYIISNFSESESVVYRFVFPLKSLLNPIFKMIKMETDVKKITIQTKLDNGIFDKILLNN